MGAIPDPPPERMMTGTGCAWWWWGIIIIVVLVIALWVFGTCSPRRMAAGPGGQTTPPVGTPPGTGPGTAARPVPP